MDDPLYEKITDALVEDGYIVLEQCCDFAPALLQEAQTLSSYKPAGISQGAKQDTNRRRDKIMWLDGESEVQKHFFEFITGLQNYLSRSLFLGLRYYEAHYARYEAGDFYEKHLDSFKTSKNRVVTTVYYLNDTQGGELIIYDKEGQKLATVKPQQATLVVFMSENFPHEVKPAKKLRFSIAGWFRVD